MALGRPATRLRGAGLARAGANRRICALVMLAVFASAGCGAPVRADEPGTIDTVVGTGEPGWLEGGYSGDADDAERARLNAPGALTFGTDGTLFIADNDNNRIRSVNPDSGTINTVVGGGTKDWARAESATSVAMPPVTDMTVDAYGDTLYIASILENQVAAVDLNQGGIAILAGRDDGGAIELPPGGMNRANGLWWPSGIDVGPDGTLYIADSGNRRILAISPHESRDEGRPDTDNVRVVAGTGAQTPEGSDGGDGGPATKATFDELGRIAVGDEGTVYFDDGSAGLRRLDPYEHTVADAGAAELPSKLEALAVAPDEGTVFAADAGGNRVLASVPGRRQPVVVAGTGTQGFAGDEEPAEQAVLDSPGGVAMSPGGDLYIADTHNQRIRVIHDVSAVIDPPPT